MTRTRDFDKGDGDGDGQAAPRWQRLNRPLDRNGFDEFAEEACREFYAEKRGRPGIPPAVYVRMLMVWYLGGDRLGAGDRVAVRGLDFAA